MKRFFILTILVVGFVVGSLPVQSVYAADLKANEVVFMGSSTIQFWETMKEDFPQFETVNLGIWGSDYGDLLNDAPRFVSEHPAPRYVIYSGDNDLANGNTPEQVLEKVEKLTSIIHEAVPQARLYVISIKPCPDRAGNIPNVMKTNQLVREFTQQAKFISYVDIFPQMLNHDGQPRAELFKEDGLHMKTDGYKIWQSILTPALQQ